MQNNYNPISISVLVAVKNEYLNIQKCLNSLKFAKHVYVIDSQSNDGTIEICDKYTNTEVIQFSYKGGYPKKRQWALDNINFHTEWILLLDADEVVTESLQDEIATIIKDESNEKEAFFIEKSFHFLGKRMKFGGFSHKAILLFKKGTCKFEYFNDNNFTKMDMEVHERLICKSITGYCKNSLIHDDFKDLSAYFMRHNDYSSWESNIRATQDQSNAINKNFFGNPQERRRYLKSIVIKLPFEPLIWFLYHYLFKLGFLEGRRGLIASCTRAFYIAQIRWKEYEALVKFNNK